MPKMKIDPLSSILNQELNVHRNNCKTVIDFTLALHKSRTVNLSQMVNNSTRTDEISANSIYKNYQRLVHNCKISQNDLAKCILKMLVVEVIAIQNRLKLLLGRYYFFHIGCKLWLLYTENCIFI